MRVYVLVATPYVAFGDLLRLSLEESGDYEIRIVSTGFDVLEAALERPVHLAILDSDLPDWPVRELARKLLERRPTMRLLVVPPDNNPNHPSVQGLTPHAFLNRPFYNPDLIGTIETVMHAGQNAVVSDPPDPLQAAGKLLPWLNQADHGREMLTAQLQATAAHACVLARSGLPVLTCGELAREDVEEFAAILGKYREGIGNSGLARYIRPASGSAQVFLYGAPVTGDIMLALIFDTSVALSRASHQARQMACAIAAMPAALEPTAALLNENSVVEAPLPQAAEALAAENKTDAPLLDPVVERLQALVLAPEAPPAESVDRVEAPLPEAPPALAGEDVCEAQAEPASDEEGFEDENDDDVFLPSDKFNLASLLASMPSPDPEPGPQKVDWIPEFLDAAGEEPVAEALPQPAPVSMAEEAVEPVVALAAPEAETPAAADEPVLQDEAGLDPIHSRYETDAAEPVAVEAPAGDATDIEAKPDIELTPSMLPVSGPEILLPWEMPEPGAMPAPQLEDTRPLRVDSEAGSKPRAMPLSRAINGDVIYTCVLSPRMANLYLTGSLADELSRLLPELSAAFGWKLAGVAVRPEYLQWTLEVPPSVSPGNLIRILRQRSSQRIFKLFPQLLPAHPQGDFWAPGYLIVSGAQTPAAGLLRDFIQQNRRRMAA